MVARPSDQAKDGKCGGSVWRGEGPPCVASARGTVTIVQAEETEPPRRNPASAGCALLSAAIPALGCRPVEPKTVKNPLTLRPSPGEVFARFARAAATLDADRRFHLGMTTTAKRTKAISTMAPAATEPPMTAGLNGSTTPGEGNAAKEMGTGEGRGATVAVADEEGDARGAVTTGWPTSPNMGDAGLIPSALAAAAAWGPIVASNVAGSANAEEMEAATAAGEGVSGPPADVSIATGASHPADPLAIARRRAALWDTMGKKSFPVKMSCES